MAAFQLTEPHAVPPPTAKALQRLLRLVSLVHRWRGGQVVPFSIGLMLMIEALGKHSGDPTRAALARQLRTTADRLDDPNPEPARVVH